MAQHILCLVIGLHNLITPPVFSLFCGDTIRCNLIIFVFSVQGLGLSEKQIEACDCFVYIPQHGCGTASLNVATAAAIALHHFAVWAGYIVACLLPSLLYQAGC